MYLKVDGRWNLGGAPYTDAKLYVDRAYLRLQSAWNWRFLTPHGSLIVAITDADTAAGAPAYDAATGLSTITATAALFDPLMVGETVTFTLSAKAYVIVSVTSSTVALVTGDASGEGPADIITVPTGFRTVLPSDFMYIVSDFKYPKGLGLSFQGEVSSDVIDKMQEQGGYGCDPFVYSIEPVLFDTTVGQLWQARWFPPFTSARALSYEYRRSYAAMVNVTDKPIGGPLHWRTILYLAYGECEVDQQGPDAGSYSVRAERMLADAIQLDKDSRAGVILGKPSRRADETPIIISRAVT